MAFIYYEEKRKFDEQWKETAQMYAAAGMSQTAIDQMHEFDWEQFKAERIWSNRIQEIDPIADEEESPCGAESPLLKKFFDRLATQYDSCGTHSRFWWIEEISSPLLLRGIRKLSTEEKELLTLYFVDGYTQSECAEILHISQCMINKRLSHILGKFTEK